MKPIGPKFTEELTLAGLVGLPFSWGSDGNIQFNERITQDQIDAVNAVYEAHDPSALPAPTPPDPIDELRQVMKADPTILEKLKAK